MHCGSCSRMTSSSICSITYHGLILNPVMRVSKWPDERLSVFFI